MTPPMSARVLFQRDFLASVVVFLVALPLCMGIAIASGVGPAAGLVTGIVGGLVVGVLQGSPLQVSGPAAGLAVIVWELVQKHGIAALGVIVAGAGVIQIVAGAFRGGRWFRAVPPSVIHGMLGGIGVLIFGGQFHVMIDDKPKGGGLRNLLSIPDALVKSVTPNADLPHEEAAMIGLLTIGAILAWNKWAPTRLKFVPAPLVGIVVGTGAAQLLALPIAYVQVSGDLLGSLRWPNTAAVSRLLEPSILGASLAMAVVASAETLLCATAVDRMHDGPRTNFNRELWAQGIGNLLCGLVGALPMTGVIVRSGANVQAGAVSRRSAILHGAWLFLVVALIPSVLRFVPVSSLAALLVFTGYKLVNPATIRELRRYGQAEVGIYALTLTAIVATDLLTGVLLGFGLSAARLLWQLSRLEIAIEDDATLRRTTLRLIGSATFLRQADLSEALERIPIDRDLHVRFEEMDYLDHATLELLENFKKQRVTRGGSLTVDWDDLYRRFHLGRGGA